VPRAAEKAIEKRYRDAVATLQNLLQTAQDNAAAAARAAEASQIDERLAMCFALDAVLTQGALTVEEADAWRSRWQAVPHLTPAARALEQVLTQRFEAVLAGTAIDTASAGEAYLQYLQQERARFDDTLLEVEIALGLDSPPELSRQRMQLQVALLQSSMKAGAPVLSGRQQLARLCALPALADQATLTRVGNVVRQALQH
jgi:exonuclease SbcC